MIHNVQQVELSQNHDSMVVWVDAGLRLKVGHEVTGKDKRRWKVIKVYAHKLQPHLLNRGWSVGGLV